MSKARILFRADAGTALGFGHVARICALIEEASARGFEAIAMFGGDHSAVRAWACDRRLVADIREWSATAVVQAAEHPRVCAMFVDGPELANTLIPKLPDRIRTIMLDDAGRSAIPVATVVNHNIHAPALAASYPVARQRLLGRRYLMLRRDIRRYTRGSCRPANGQRLRVIISFGGSDPVGATARTLTMLPADRALELVVIAGPGYRDDEALHSAIAVATTAGHTVDLQRSPEDPGALFVSADAAICSAGGTLGELAFLGCPALAYAIVHDQVAPARQQERQGMIAGGRTWGETDDDILRDDIRAFITDDLARAQLRSHALATADSEGPRRIFDEACDLGAQARTG
jgi:spore coat polysaccharide biosynthesis predicted glycosyltransferase SpsG